MMTIFAVSYQRSPTKDRKEFLLVTNLPSTEFISRYTNPSPDCFIDSNSIATWMAMGIRPSATTVTTASGTPPSRAHPCFLQTQGHLNVQFLYQPLAFSASLLKQKRQDRVNEVLRKEDSKSCDQFSCLHFQKVSVPFIAPSVALMLQQGVQNFIALWSAGQGKIVCPVEKKMMVPSNDGSVLWAWICCTFIVRHRLLIRCGGTYL